MHPQVARSLVMIKDAYSLLLKIVVESNGRQNQILRKQVELLRTSNEKLRATGDASKPDFAAMQAKNQALQKKLTAANQDRRLLLSLLKGKS